LRETHIPTPFVLVNPENQAGIGWRVVSRGVNEKKVAPHLANQNRISVDEQTHGYLGGMSTLT
jgi:hypothetical protein